jgi:hypothetical protein
MDLLETAGGFLSRDSGLTCFCGKSFPQQSALTNHTRSCQRSKKRLTNALSSAKEVWIARKRKKLQPPGELEESVELPSTVLEIDEPLPNLVCD